MPDFTFVGEWLWPKVCYVVLQHRKIFWGILQPLKMLCSGVDKHSISEKLIHYSSVLVSWHISNCELVVTTTESASSFPGSSSNAEIHLIWFLYRLVLHAKITSHAFMSPLEMSLARVHLQTENIPRVWRDLKSLNHRSRNGFQQQRSEEFEVGENQRARNCNKILGINERTLNAVLLWYCK